MTDITDRLGRLFAPKSYSATQLLFPFILVAISIYVAHWMQVSWFGDTISLIPILFVVGTLIIQGPLFLLIIIRQIRFLILQSRNRSGTSAR